MKYVIASDIHGSAYYCRLLKKRYEEEKAQKLLLLGDLLYHGARNALPKEYSTLETALPRPCRRHAHMEGRRNGHPLSHRTSVLITKFAHLF